MNFIDRLIEADMRRFNVKKILLAMATIAVGLSVYSKFGIIASYLLVGIVLFWLACGLFFCSDTIDHRPHEERVWAAKILNVAGIFLSAASYVLAIGGSIILLMFIWLA